MSNDWVPFHESLRRGSKRGIPRALRFVSGAEIPKINAPATGEEILMRLTKYANVGQALMAVSS